MKKRFIFDEKFNKKTAKKNIIKYLPIAGISLGIILFIVLIMIFVKPKDNNKNNFPEFLLVDKLIVESGAEVPNVSEYFEKRKNLNLEDVEIIYPKDFEYSLDLTKCTAKENEEINNGSNIENYLCAKKILKNQSVYGITLKFLEKEYTVPLEIKDTTPPNVITKNHKIFENETYNIQDFIINCTDTNGICSYKYYDKDNEGNEVDYSKITAVGTHIVKIIAKDKYDNYTEPVDVTLEITKTEKKLYNITFNVDNQKYEEIKAEEGSTIKEPIKPEKSGYLFLGWSYNNQKHDFTTKVQNDMTLSAIWYKIDNNENLDNPNNNEQPIIPDDKPQIIEVTSVYLDYQKISLYINDSKTVKATVKPNNASDKTVVWKSENSQIATVNNGVITGLKAGETTITATAGGKSSSVKVVVKEKNNGNSCLYGDTLYDKGNYTLSVDLTKNNCAVDPNISYNESVSTNDYTKLINDISNLGFSINKDYFNYKLQKPVYIRNNAGTGLVGYELTVQVQVKSLDNYNLLTAKYIINSDGSRKFIENNICVNSRCLK